MSATQWVDRAASALARRTSRRGFLARTAVVGTALAVDPLSYVLTPVSAADSVCGDGATCGSGWTVFCVTVNKGVNACPPNSFAAGWWKADRASVCGGKARYYIDCNATCIDGRAGSYAYHCYCPKTGCDQRRVACNQFRYGQCNQATHCYGPVVCRVISCVAPWEWANCTSTSATDDRTLTHSAPALPHSWDAIEQRYSALGGPGSVLGASTGGRLGWPHGAMQDYLQGLLAGPLGAAYVLHATAAGYRAAGGPHALGFPTADEKPTNDGLAHLVPLQSATLWAQGATAHHTMTGAWAAAWTALATQRSHAGTPTSDVVATADGAGRIGTFTQGSLLWSSATGAHAVTGAADTVYAGMQRQAGALGYPTTDTTAVTDASAGGAGTVTTFEHGVVATSSAGAYALTGSVASYWSGHGREAGPLAWPTSGVAAARVSGAQVAHFVGGDVYAGSAGTFAVIEPVLDSYRQAGAEAGSYGLPIADAVTDGATVSQQFSGGTITASTGGSPAPSSTPSA